MSRVRPGHSSCDPLIPYLEVTEFTFEFGSRFQLTGPQKRSPAELPAR